MPWIHDGSNGLPRLRVDLSLGTLSDLPTDSEGPRGEAPDAFAAIRAAGFEGVQASPALAERVRDAGLRLTTSGRIDAPGDARRLAEEALAAGADATTLHIGTGFEDDATADRLIESVIRASEDSGLPLFVETHRATLTQDPHRTIRIAERHPALRFNADLSHYYCGAEMVYGDWEAKLRLLAPIFERSGFLHGRISSPGCIQVDVGDGSETGRPHVAHFNQLWSLVFSGFLRSATPGSIIVFAPELLPSRIAYARQFEGREEGDRWQQALVLSRLARECFESARSTPSTHPGPN